MTIKGDALLKPEAMRTLEEEIHMEVLSSHQL